MSNAIPGWLQSLSQAGTPIYGSFCPGSPLNVWHVKVQFQAWEAPPGAVLRGTANWNGKALVVGIDSGLDVSVGEVEIAARLRITGAHAAWTGKPRKPWSDWSLNADARNTWVNSVDAMVRQGVPLLESNARGLPDVLHWRSGAADFCCVEYKGPSPSKPSRPDTVKAEQMAWVTSAVERRVLTQDRIAVVSWQPNAGSTAALIRQAAASKRGREARLAERNT